MNTFSIPHCCREKPEQPRLRQSGSRKQLRMVRLSKSAFARYANQPTPESVERRGLIVDDETAVCEMVGKVLSSAGIEALTLTNSTGAPGLFNEGKFDVVFLDLHMAARDGIELARQVRVSRWNRATPIVLISDDQRPSAMSVGFEAGASFFLYKPIDKDRLLKLIRATQGPAEQERRRTRRIAIQSKERLRYRP